MSTQWHSPWRAGSLVQEPFSKLAMPWWRWTEFQQLLKITLSLAVPLSPHPIDEGFFLAMPTVTFTNLKKKIIVPEGAVLRREAQKQGIPMHSGPHRYINCGGMGMCASCRVCIKKGEENLKRKRWWESVLQFWNPVWFFARIGHEKDLTLACQTRVMGDCEVEATPEMNWHGDQFWN